MKFQRYETKPRAEGVKNTSYLKIAEGQPVIAVLRGELHTFFKRWHEGKSEVVVEGTPGGKRKFSVNAVIYENGGFVAKVWEFSGPVYDQLYEINEEYPLSQIKIKITRKGQKLDTEYKILPLLKDEDKLTTEILNAINAVPLNILDKPAQSPPPLPRPQEEERKSAWDEGDNWNGF